MLSTPAFGDAPHPERANIKAQGEHNRANLALRTYLTNNQPEQQRSLGWPEQAIDYLADVRRLHDPASLVTVLQTVPDWVLFPDLSALANFDRPTMITARQNDPIHPASLAECMAGMFSDTRLVYTGSIPDFLLYPERSGRLFEPFLNNLRMMGE